MKGMTSALPMRKMRESTKARHTPKGDQGVISVPVVFEVIDGASVKPPSLLTSYREIIPLP